MWDRKEEDKNVRENVWCLLKCEKNFSSDERRMKSLNRTKQIIGIFSFVFWKFICVNAFADCLLTRLLSFALDAFHFNDDNDNCKISFWGSKSHQRRSSSILKRTICGNHLNNMDRSIFLTQTMDYKTN